MCKGQEDGTCNRSHCQHTATWYNHGSFAWYCTRCKNDIYDFVGKTLWYRDFPDAEHPMFETREMLTARGVTDVHVM